MGFIVDSLANVFLEILDTLIIWVCDLSVSFNLDIGEDTSLFHQTFLKTTQAEKAFADFGFGIGALAMMIVILVTILKIYQLMADPFTRSESPGSIFLRFIFAGVGVIGSYEFFKYFQKGFNAAYQLFSAPYNSITDAFKQRNAYVLEKVEEAESTPNDRHIGATHGYESTSDYNSDNAGDAFIFGKDKLINPDEAISSHTTALALIELVVGGALLICLVKLIFEIYERYVIIAVLYILSPLAFATIISSQSKVFKNYVVMVASQFVLMCTNLLFLGVFMRAWYDILQKGTTKEYFFESSQSFVTTMLLMIGWLIAGQRLDEHMRTAGLSAAQTGQGIMGAALGSMFLARAAVGGLVGAGGAALGTTGAALAGQTAAQKAWEAGIESDGKRGGLIGKMAHAMNPDSGGTSSSGSGSVTEGASLEDALNNSIKGTSGSSGTSAPQFGGSDSDAREAFDAGSLDWQPLAGYEGISQAYDEGSNTTITRGTDDAGNTTIQTNFGGTTDRVPEIDAINYGEGVQYYHVSSGNTVGSMPERESRPRSRKDLEKEWS